MIRLFLLGLTTLTLHAQKNKKKSDVTPPPEPPRCLVNLTNSKGLARYKHRALGLAPAETRIVEAMVNDRLFKRRVMEKSTQLFGTNDGQAQLFRTILDPQRVAKMVRSIDPATKEFETFATALDEILGVTVAEAEAKGLFAFYADEIAAILPKRLRAKPAANETTFRFATRNADDLAAFESFDDGYSVGREHYERALHQFANGAYQILYAERGGRVLVKFGLTPMIVDRRPALMIDFVEVDYRAGNVEDRLIGTDARGAVIDALRFLMARTEEMNHGLFGVIASKTEWVRLRLQKGEAYGAPAQFAGQAVHARFATLAEGNVDYRVLEPRRSLVFDAGEGEHRQRELFAQAIAPAVERDATLATRLEELTEIGTKLKRERILASLARDLISRDDLVAGVKAVFGVPAQYPIDERFFVKKLDQFHPVRQRDRSVWSDSFVIPRPVFRYSTKRIRFGQR